MILTVKQIAEISGFSLTHVKRIIKEHNLDKDRDSYYLKIDSKHLKLFTRQRNKFT